MGSEGQRRAGGGKTHSKVHKSFILDDNSDDDEIDENDDNETSYLDSLNEAIESPEYDENSYQQFGDSNLNVKAASSFDTRQDNRKYFNTNKILEVHDIFGVSEDEDDESQNANYNDENLPNADPNATSDDTYSNISFIAKDDEDQSEHGGSYGSAHEDHVKDIRDKKRQELAVKEDPTDDVDKVNIDNKLDEKKTEGKILKAHLGPGLKRATISDRFTQDECEQHFLTARQQIVALRDVPERFLTCDPVLTPPESMAELEAEAEWIYQEIFSETPLSFTQYNNKLLDKGVLPKIRNTLDLLRNQYLEVPFIFTYRKEFVFPGLNISDLWKIYEYNSKWSNLKQQKAALNTLVEAVIDSQFEKCVESNQKSLHNTESVAPFSKLIDQTMINTIASLTEFEKIDDHLLYLNFYFSDILVKKHLTGDNQKIPTTNSIYARCRELNLTQVSANFGLLPHQLAENLVQNFSVNNVQQRDEDLSAVAEPYICDQLPTIAKVIEAIIWLVAHEISVEPAINDFVRKQIYEHSLVSTKPTRQGLDQIDKTHPYFQYKYLKNKPLSEFQQTEFLEIFDAEDQGFLEVIFRLEAEEPGKSKSSLFEQMLQFYQINQYSLISQSWDKYRQKALNIAVNHLILPRLFNDLKVKLRAKSKEYLLDMYCVEFNALISSPPFFSSQRPNSSQNTQSGSSKNYSDTINQENPSNSAKINHSETPKDDLGWGDDEDDANESIVKQPEQVETPSSRTDDANKLDASDIQKMIDRAAAGDPESNELASSPKIMSFVYSNDPQVHVAVVCILDAHGNFIDHLLLNNFDYGRLSSASNITLKANDVKEVKDFIKLHQPTDIVLSTQSSKAKNFRFEFRMILSRLSEDFMQAKQIELHYSDHRVANLYKNSSLASKEFPNVIYLL
ncbi:MAG: Transcription elongation factor SPT6 [Marteilia pararefringens]